jgi:hypothetical protein
MPNVVARLEHGRERSNLAPFGVSLRVRAFAKAHSQEKQNLHQDCEFGLRNRLNASRGCCFEAQQGRRTPSISADRDRSGPIAAIHWLQNAKGSVLEKLAVAKKRHDILKSPTENLQLADLPASALRKNPKPNTQLSRVELGIGVAILLVLLGLRWFYVNAQRWDSDEPQHLHVVWAWANGMLPYKDVFDNHSPLFQAISAPFFALLGERADIVTAMRWIMVPIAGLILAMSYLIGAQLFSPRVGLWGTLLTATFPAFYFKTGEYRPDVLWAALWLIALVILTAGRPHPRRLFAAGLTFGIAFAVSMKTTFLALIVLTAALAVWLLRAAVPGSRGSPQMSGYHIIGSLLAPVTGVLIVPLIVVAFFAWHGVLEQMYYCVIVHNIISEGDPWRIFLQRTLDVRFWWFIPLIAGGLWLAQFDDNRDRALRRLFFLCVTGFYCPLLFAFWPLLTMQDYIPFFPIWILALACPLVGIAEWIRQKIALPVSLLPALLVSGQLVWMVCGHPPWKQTNQRNLKVISDTLNLTNRGETVFDSRGETIFRPRPYYYVFEQITRERVGRGELPDDAPARLVAARTPVAVPASWLTKATRQFMDQNYISLGSVLVPGKRIFPPPDGHAQFKVMIPEKYTIVGKSGPLSGTLDGANLNGPHDLSAGVHQLILNSPVDVAAVVWSRAVEKAYSPF